MIEWMNEDRMNDHLVGWMHDTADCNNVERVAKPMQRAKAEKFGFKSNSIKLKVVNSNPRIWFWNVWGEL